MKIVFIYYFIFVILLILLNLIIQQIIGILPKESLGGKTNPNEELDETGRAIDRLLK
jgi:hypothetical protein